jgi:hypothetical protein
MALLPLPGRLYGVPRRSRRDPVTDLYKPVGGQPGGAVAAADADQWRFDGPAQRPRRADAEEPGRAAGKRSTA